ncbi:uncharacterized protein LOC111597546 isoform X2 [Drosophila hydei]|uniref:Uncharacterized protein LOC111597546 isoform X2 n=1 Tax=Drosophila hydei TaxID=7224 RepID=A0A6J1LSM6_DROHY|nr:uncharacterized protein LOC111597546 isoform X2 [Drosophila hydei]
MLPIQTHIHIHMYHYYNLYIVFSTLFIAVASRKATPTPTPLGRKLQMLAYSNELRAGRCASSRAKDEHNDISSRGSALERRKSTSGAGGGLTGVRFVSVRGILTKTNPEEQSQPNMKGLHCQICQPKDL